MNGPKIVLVGPIAIAWDNPARMKYGGVERTGWRLTHLLSAVGYDVLPVAPSDSGFCQSISRRGLWPGSSLHQPNRRPQAFAEDVAPIIDDYARHVRDVLIAERPHVIILLGPAAQILNTIERHIPAAIDRLIVALHNGPSDNIQTIPILKRLRGARLIALSNAQRLAFGELSKRIEVVLDGIPVEAVPFSLRPDEVRGQIARDGVLGRSIINPRRRIISQVDYFHPSKGMLLSLELFRLSELYLSHDLLLAGGMGWQLPEHGASGRPRLGARYLDRMHAYVEQHSLQGSVRILGDLTGAQTVNLLMASDIALSPVRMAHGPLWPDGQVAGDPESYGQGRAIGNAAGTPVLMSEKYDSSFAPDDMQFLRFGDISTGIERLKKVATDYVDVRTRKRLRSFAVGRDSIRPGFVRYLELIADICDGTQGVLLRVPARPVVDLAIQKLVAMETGALVATQ